MALPAIRRAAPLAGIAALIGAAAWWSRARTAEAEPRTRTRLASRHQHTAPSAADIHIG